MRESKTNAMRLFDRAQKPYRVHSYGDGQSFSDGVSVARAVGFPPEQLFKTLVTHGASGGYFVFVIPADCELHLKKAARAAGEKAIEMLPMKDLKNVTGYIRGGCSPFAMKKQFPTVFDETAILFETILVSAGVLGCQIEAAPEDMVTLAAATYADLCQD